MANTTISKPAGGSITLDGDGNAFITENNCRKESTLAAMPLYLLDSDETDVFDFGGVVKTINLTGIYFSTSEISALKTFVDLLEALVQGHQDIAAGYPLTFTDDLRGAIKVKVVDIDSTNLAGEPTILVWTLKLLQSSESA